ncbi:MAG: DUF58 domain-containing protein [Chthoniobacterales bacterium]
MAVLFDTEFLAKLEHLYLLSQRIFRGAARAERKSRHIGSSLEFADYRNYVAGDDPRTIDWNVYGRLDRLFVKLFEEEEDLHVYLLVDSSASMAWQAGGISKFDQARRIAAALAYISLANLDRVNVHAFDDTLGVDCGLSRGKSQFHQILSFLGALECSERTTSLRKAIQRFVQRVRRRGLVILISDFFDPEGYQMALNLLRFQRFELQVIQLVDPAELAPDLSGDFQLLDCETGQALDVTSNQSARAAFTAEVTKFLKGLERYCLESRTGFLQATTNDPFEDLILRVLRKRRLAA